jgi:hypothetical protein
MSAIALATAAGARPPAATSTSIQEDRRQPQVVEKACLDERRPVSTAFKSKLNRKK